MCLLENGTNLFQIVIVCNQIISYKSTRNKTRFVLAIYYGSKRVNHNNTNHNCSWYLRIIFYNILSNPLLYLYDRQYLVYRLIFLIPSKWRNQWKSVDD